MLVPISLNEVILYVKPIALSLFNKDNYKTGIIRGKNIILLTNHVNFVCHINGGIFVSKKERIEKVNSNSIF